MNSQHLKFAELVQTIDAVFYQIEMNNFLEVDNVINPDFTNFFNGFDSYITLHDLQKLKPIFINDKMKNYYGFEKNTFQDIDYFYYFTTIHPSSYHTLLDSVVHFKKGGEGYLKLEYKLKNNVGKFEQFLGVTKSIFINEKPVFALSLLKKKEDASRENNQNDLTKRELEIILLICKGKKQNEISDQLSISVETTKVHIRNIYRKLDINSSQELMVLYKDYLE
ncbi:MAG: response regulator transcription factor [Chryseobacterium sp.]|nr:response regulator transcription factor [Chryseobacterium sp.]MBP7499893.1 response regulator transcription factor [Chryseobacterium sp.]